MPRAIDASAVCYYAFAGISPPLIAELLFATLIRRCRHAANATPLILMPMLRHYAVQAPPFYCYADAAIDYADVIFRRYAMLRHAAAARCLCYASPSRFSLFFRRRHYYCWLRHVTLMPLLLLMHYADIDTLPLD